MQAKVPAKAAEYFGSGHHPLIVGYFYPHGGWKRHPLNKRVSGSELRRLRAKGVTAVALQQGTRVADFQISELI